MNCNQVFIFWICLIISLLTSCKKIDYYSAEKMEFAISGLSQNQDPASVITKLVENDSLPKQVRNTLNNIYEYATQDDSISALEIEQLKYWLSQTIQFLYFRRNELHKPFISSFSPTYLAEYWFDDEKVHSLTVRGIGLTKADFHPQLIKGDLQIQISSLYIDYSSDTLATIRLGGANGLPIDSTVLALKLDASPVSIPVKSRLENKFDLQVEAHVRYKGWEKTKTFGDWVGTRGQGVRIESFRAMLHDNPCGIEYKVFQQDIGESEWLTAGKEAGEAGSGNKITALWIRLTNCVEYEIEYEGHVQDIGDTGWISQGTKLGSINNDKRIEAIRLRIVHAE